MKKTIIALALTTISAPIFAQTDASQAEFKPSPYISIGSASITPDGYSFEPSGIAITLGGDFNRVFGLSLNYTSQDDTQGGLKAEVTSFGVNSDIGWTFIPNRDFTIKPYGIIGVNNAKVTLSNSYAEAESDSMYLRSGVGVRATIKQHFVVSAQFSVNVANEDYMPDYDQTQFSVGYKF